MKVYKIRHKPTGLYWQPSRTNGNFSVNGRIYAKKPNLKKMQYVRVIIRFHNGHISEKDELLIHHFNIDDIEMNIRTWTQFDRHFKFNADEWEIIEL